MGADLRIENLSERHGELTGDIRVRTSPVRGGVIEKEMTAALIDEIPVLAVLGAASEGGLRVRDAAELRVKETDRIATIAENLKRLGVSVEVYEDGFFVPGGQQFQAAELDSFGDHRIAMACAVAALRAGGECTIQGAEAASVSFPGFFATLRNFGDRLRNR
jgi:3-phosphoshikimate 1-carboxyvinyltransferase